MFNEYSDELESIMLSAKSEKDNLLHEKIGTEHILLSILKSNNEICKILNKNGVNYTNCKEYIVNNNGIGNDNSNYFIYSPLLKKILVDINNQNTNVITTPILFKAIINTDSKALQILYGISNNIDFLIEEINSMVENNIKDKKTLLDFGINLNEYAEKGYIDPVIKREKETKNIIEILNRRYKNNPLLIGEAGVGKTAIIENLANKINNNEIPSLNNKTIISLDMASIVSGTKYRGEFESRLKEIIYEAESNDDIILFIDEIHTIVGAGGAEGAIDASNILKPALARGKIKFIGATTVEEYKKYIEKDKALNRRFQKVEIEEPDIKTTKIILYNIKNTYEKYHNVKINNKIIDYIIKLTNIYFKDRHEPDRSIDVLDDVLSKVSLKNNINDITINESNKILKKIKDDKINFIKNNNYIEAYNCKRKENEIENSINILLNSKKNTNKKITKKDVNDVIKEKINIPLYNLNKKCIKNEINKITKNKINRDNLYNIISKNKLDNNTLKFVLFITKNNNEKVIVNKYINLLFKNNIIKINYENNSNIFSILEEKTKAYPMAVLIDNINIKDKIFFNKIYEYIKNGYIVNENKKINISNISFFFILNESNNSIGFTNQTNINSLFKNDITYNIIRLDS